MRINAVLDAGLRRHDEIMVAAAIFNKLLEHEFASSIHYSRFTIHAFVMRESGRWIFS
jgi:hypothetical protein